MKKCNARGSAARDPHGIKQINVGPPHGIKQITMFIRENVDVIYLKEDSRFTLEQTGSSAGYASHNCVTRTTGLWTCVTRCVGLAGTTTGFRDTLCRLSWGIRQNDKSKQHT
ncbi:hypothetical protein J6590_086217 [Homalodisca vitripennis]|nr:hypothetical protein J6590_086217 [Homalodisca vitripennis]